MKKQIEHYHVVFLSFLAQTYQVDIVAGSVSNKRNNKVYNTAFTVSKEGRRINNMIKFI